jgi:DNA-binding beta-propeller fold protein YncE
LRIGRIRLATSAITALAALVAILFATPGFAAAASGRALVAAAGGPYGDGQIIPINTQTGTPKTPIDVDAPQGIAVAPDGKTAYVTSGLDAVIKIDLITDTAGPHIRVGIDPKAIAITPDGKTAYVVGSKKVVPIDLATNTPGPPITVGEGPTSIAITPDGKAAFVVNLDSNNVTRINLVTNTPGPTIGLPSGLHAFVAITPNGTTALVTNARSAQLVPINIATNTVGAPIKLDGGPVTGGIVAGSGGVWVATQPPKGPESACSSILRQECLYVTKIGQATLTPEWPPGLVKTGGTKAVPLAMAISADGGTICIEARSDIGGRPGPELSISVWTGSESIGGRRIWEHKGGRPDGLAIAPGS